MPTISTGTQRQGTRREPTHAEIQNFARAIATEREMLQRARIVPANTFGRLPATGTPMESLKGYAGADVTPAVGVPSEDHRGFVNAVVAAADPEARRSGFPGSKWPVTNMRSAHEAPPPPPPPPGTFEMDMGNGKEYFPAGDPASVAAPSVPTLSAVDPPPTREDTNHRTFDQVVAGIPAQQRLGDTQWPVQDHGGLPRSAGIGYSSAAQAVIDAEQHARSMASLDSAARQAAPPTRRFREGEREAFLKSVADRPGGQVWGERGYQSDLTPTEEALLQNPYIPRPEEHPIAGVGAPVTSAVGDFLYGGTVAPIQKAGQMVGATIYEGPEAALRQRSTPVAPRPLTGVSTAPTSSTEAQNQGGGILSALGSLPGLPARAGVAAKESLAGFVAGGRAADFERQHQLQDSLADQLGYERGDNIYVDPITGAQLGANPYDPADDPGPGEMMLGPARSNIVRGGNGTITAVPGASLSNEYVVNPTTGEPEQLGENRRYFDNDGYAIDRAPAGASQAATTDENGVTTFPGLKAAATTRAQDLKREIDFRREKMGGTGYFAPSPEEAARHQAALASAQAELEQIGRQDAEQMDALSRVAAANVRAQGKAATEQTDNRAEVLGVAQALAQQIGLEGDPSVLLKPIGRGVWTINDTAFKHFTKSSGDQRVDMERARLFQSMAATIDKSLSGIASYSMKPEERLAMVAERDRLNGLAMSLAGGTGGGAPLSEDDAAVMEYLDTLDPEE